ncbi:hypothetical protein HDU76_006264, partial [Blyttiomyces sp. JEL0837]
MWYPWILRIPTLIVMTTRTHLNLKLALFFDHVPLRHVKLTLQHWSITPQLHRNQSHESPTYTTLSMDSMQPSSLAITPPADTISLTAKGLQHLQEPSPYSLVIFCNTVLNHGDLQMEVNFRVCHSLSMKH